MMTALQFICPHYGDTIPRAPKPGDLPVEQPTKFDAKGSGLVRRGCVERYGLDGEPIRFYHDEAVPMPLGIRFGATLAAAALDDYL
jgi:hypothetical protein